MVCCGAWVREEEWVEDWMSRGEVGQRRVGYVRGGGGGGGGERREGREGSLSDRLREQKKDVVQVSSPLTDPVCLFLCACVCVCVLVSFTCFTLHSEQSALPDPLLLSCPPSLVMSL